jgi:erythromycin esterase-like protein
VVWAHNSHIGDAAWTEMGQVRGELNIGQLVRDRFGEEARLIGFGTHTGTVAAATDWDGAMEIKRVRPSLPGSQEALCHATGLPCFLLDLRDDWAADLRAGLMTPRLERFIGVIYRPETERWSHYSEAILPRQFDAWVWFDETGAVTPLPGAEAAVGEDDLWPFGL